MKITESINELVSGKSPINKNSSLDKNSNSRLWHYSQIFQRIGQLLLDIIYPEKDHCLNCGRELFFPEISGLCSGCLQQIDFLTDFCQHCGRKIKSVRKVKGLHQTRKNLCSYCQSHTFSFIQSRSIAVYNGLFRDLILNYKYNAEKDLVIPLAHLLKLHFYKYYETTPIDYILAVPLHKRKLELRGFNQARLLAVELAKHTCIPLLEDTLLRVKDSPALYNLNQKQRQQVIKGVFRYNKRGHISYNSDERAFIKNLRQDFSYNADIKNKNILLIDDIYTTGTTVDEAARVLQENGAGDIYVLTLATADLT